MRTDIENMLRQIGARVGKAPYGYTYMLERLSANLKELRDRTLAGDMTALDEFFRHYVFDDGKDYGDVRPDLCPHGYKRDDLRTGASTCEPCSELETIDAFSARVSE